MRAGVAIFYLTMLERRQREPITTTTEIGIRKNVVDNGEEGAIEVQTTTPS